MFVESLEQFPEDIHGDFVETEMDGKKGFMHKSDEPLINSLKNAKSERENLRKQYEEVNGQLDQLKKGQREEIERAKAEALEAAKTKGAKEDVIQQYEERLEDLEKRGNETAKQYEERIDKLTGNLKSKTKTAVVSDIAKELSTDVGYNLFKKVLADRIDVDVETGKEIYLNEDGSASSLDKKGFMEEIKKDDSFKPLLKSGVVTQGGGNANGNGDGSASTVKTAPRAEFDGWSQGKRSQFVKAGGKVVND